MQFQRHQSYQDFINKNPAIRNYDGSRSALGVNPGKLAMIFVGDQHVASVVFIDHLYYDGREIYIPAFDKRISNSDALRARMDAHKFIETETANRLGLESLRSAYTDVYPQCPMYWDITAKLETVAVQDTPKQDKKEIQLSFF